MIEDGHILVAEVRAAAARHRIAWGELVPSPHEVNSAAEPAEEAAWTEMEAAKQRLRDHICTLYGISSAELCSLAR
jgi:hypothetical protein